MTRRCVGHGGPCQCAQPAHWDACCSSDPLHARTSRSRAQRLRQWNPQYHRRFIETSHHDELSGNEVKQISDGHDSLWRSSCCKTERRHTDHGQTFHVQTLVCRTGTFTTRRSRAVTRSASCQWRDSIASSPLAVWRKSACTPISAFGFLIEPDSFQLESHGSCEGLLWSWRSVRLYHALRYVEWFSVQLLYWLRLIRHVDDLFSSSLLSTLCSVFF